MYFFTENGADLPTQGSSDAFGPDSNVANEQSTYHVSARFQLAVPTSSPLLKAFACENSMMIVTDNISGTDLVNVILKPRPAPGRINRFPQVAYYIYRGLDKASFFDVTSTSTPPSITPQDPSNTQTIAKMWAGSPPTPEAINLGYDASITGTTPIEKIFNKVQPNIQCREVNEGEWIANFRRNGEICFEVILDSDAVKVDLDYVKMASAKVEIGTLTGLALKAKREEILAYIDPAAFFASFWEKGLSVSSQPNPLTGTTLLNSVLIKFATHKRVYLDIRSEFGKSYNFYANYKDGTTSNNNIKFGNTETAPAAQKYETKSWPIIFFESPMTTTETFNDIRFHLRIDDNRSPLLFNLKTDPTSVTEPQFLTDDKLFTTGSTDWTKEISVRFPNFGSGTAKDNVSTYFLFYYFRRKKDTSMPASVFKFDHYLSTVFGGVSLPGVESTNPSVGQVKNTRLRLNNKGTAYTYVSASGAVFNADAAMLYVENIASFKKSGKVFPKADFGVFATVPSFSVAADTVLPKTIAYNKWRITVLSSTTDILDIALFNKNSVDTPVEDVFYLCLTRAEFDRLRFLTGLSPHHDRFLVFTETNAVDDNGTPYTKYKVQIQGISPSTGNPIIVNPATSTSSSTPGPDIFVYSSGENMLSSPGFTALADLPNQLPDPGNYKTWADVGKYDYDQNSSEIKTMFPAVTTFPNVTEGYVALADENVFADGGVQKVLSTSPQAPVRGIVRFPSDSSGSDVLSSRQASYYLIVIVPGNGHDYLKYAPLCEYLAQNGFIAASISIQLMIRDFELHSVTPAVATTHALTGFDYFFAPNANAGDIYFYNSTTKKIATYTPSYLVINDTGSTITTSTTTAAKTEQAYTEGTQFTVDLTSSPKLIHLKIDLAALSHGMGAVGRANLLFNNLKVLNSKFGTQINSAGIGIMGHSRGGEGVLNAAANIVASTIPPSSLKTIKAILSLAPSDQFKKESLTQNIPYNVIYGSKDGDISGVRIYFGTPEAARGTGFALYDRAQNNEEKAMQFVIDATHNGFITDNHDFKGKPVLEFKVQQAITFAYVNAFFRKHLLGENFWKPIFTGDEIPTSVQVSASKEKKIQPQYREKATNRQVVYNNGNLFSGVTMSATVISTPTSGPLYVPATTNDTSPHDIIGLHVSWKGTGRVKFSIPSAIQNVTPFDFISFRITHVRGSYNVKLDKLQLSLKDTVSTSEVKVKIPRAIPQPQTRKGNPDGTNPVQETLTKAAMITIRVPLIDFAAGGIDLTKVSELAFVFPGTTADVGKIQLEDIEFTK